LNILLRHRQCPTEYAIAVVLDSCGKIVVAPSQRATRAERATRLDVRRSPGRPPLVRRWSGLGMRSGWSGCRVGFAPTRMRRLFTAHTNADIGKDNQRAVWAITDVLIRQRRKPSPQKASRRSAGWYKATRPFFGPRPKTSWSPCTPSRSCS
jgi:hypothetical protein